MRTDHKRLAEVIRRHWDERAGTFDDEVGHGRLVSDEQHRAWLDLLSRRTGEAPQRVLDVGCGTGFLALRFAELGHAVTGLDLSPRMIDRARRNAMDGGHDTEFLVGDAAALDFPDEMFDVVTARHVIWILPEPERGLAEWLRVLRPGGRLVLIEGRWGDEEPRVTRHAHRAPQIAARVLDAGTSFVLRHADRFPQKLLDRQYHRVETELRFSGGPPATQLAELMEANSVRDVSIESLMEPTLWGGLPKFPRYLVTGIREPAPKR
jgi:ubiquinone/menaquinone biosynthesis C-methylase UbiE